MTSKDLFDKLSALEKEANQPNADRDKIMSDVRNSFRRDRLFEQLVRDVLVDQNTSIDQTLYHFSDLGVLVAALIERFDIDD